MSFCKGVLRQTTFYILAAILLPLKTRTSLFDPTSLIAETAKAKTGDIITLNVYEARKKELEKIRSFFETTFREKQDKEIANINTEASNLKNQRELLIQRPESKSKNKLIDLIQEHQETLSDRIETWVSFSATISDHIGFIENNQDLLDQQAVKDQLSKAEQPPRYTLKDLSEIENKISSLDEKKEINERQKNTTEIKKGEEESNLDFLKKELNKLNKKETGLSEKAEKEDSDIETISEVVVAEIQLINSKISLSERRIEQAKFHLDFLTRESEFIKARKKTILEPTLTIIKNKILVDPLSLTKLEENIATKQQEITQSLDIISNEINAKRNQKNQLSQSLEITKRAHKSQKELFSKQENNEELKLIVFALETKTLAINLELESLSQEISHLYFKKKKLLTETDQDEFNLTRAKGIFYLLTGQGTDLKQTFKQIRENQVQRIQKDNEKLEVNVSEIDSFLQEATL